MSKVFIVEDDEIIAKMVAEHLKSWKMEVRCANGLKNVTEEIKGFSPDIVLMDINLPYYNGFYWCAEIRKFSKIPIVFLSSADDNMNIVMAMNMGADDFIAKPFDGNVLMAKIQALLRRTYDFTAAVPLLEHRGSLFNKEDGSLTYEGQKISLTKNEARILSALLENKGRTVSREKLMERLWETDSFVDENTLTVNVNRLRRKLNEAGLTNFITTRFGEGYLISV